MRARAVTVVVLMLAGLGFGAPAGADIAPPGLNGLGDAHLWVGLRNSDDQGTQFDVMEQLFQDGNEVASGLTRCITALTRNPLLAKQVSVPWSSFTPIATSANDVFTVKLSARIGTNPDGTKCPGPGGSHNSAVSLRFYYDGASRDSEFDATVGTSTSAAFFHSDGGACDKPVATTESRGVTTRFLDPSVPGAPAPAKCKDSGVVDLARGNNWSTIGIWTWAVS